MDKFASLPKRPTSLSELQSQWGLSRQATWDRLRRARARSLVVRYRRGIYAPRTAAEPRLPDTAQAVVAALGSIRAYRWAISGLDLILGELHYLPAHYPHLVLVEPAGEDVVRGALGAAGYVAVSPRSIADVWKSNPTQPVAVVRAVSNFRGVPADSVSASPERAFVDLLVEIRRGFPFPGRDLERIWAQLPPSGRRTIARLGKQLHRRPFFKSSGPPDQITNLELGVE